MAQRKLKLAEVLKSYTLLTGEDVEVVADEATDSAFVEDEILSLADANREPIISQKIKGTLESDINKNVLGKVSNAVKKELIATTGVPESEIKDKTYNEAVKISVAHYAKSLGTDKESAAEQLKTVMAAHELELKNRDTTYATKESEWQRKIDRYGIDAVMSQLYAGAKEIDTKADKAVLQSDFTEYLEKNYGLKVSADGKSIDLMDRADGTKLAMNKAGTQALKLSEVQKEYHKARNQWNENPANVNPADTLKSNVKDHFVKQGDKVLSPNQQAEQELMNRLGVEA